MGRFVAAWRALAPGRWSGIFLVAACCLSFAFVPARAEVPSFPKVADAVAFFEGFVPAAQGSVVSVIDQLVYTDIGQEAGLRPGSELVVYREGDDILHPLTKQVLGRFETVLGVLRVGKAMGGYTVGELAGGSAGVVRPGDRIRISSGRLRMAMVPQAEPGQAPSRHPWMSDLYAALEKSARFSPVDLQDWSAPRSPAADDWVRLAGEHHVDGFLRAAAVEEGGSLMVKLELLSGATGLTMAEATCRVPAAKGAPVRSEAAPPDRREKDKPAGPPPPLPAEDPGR